MKFPEPSLTPQRVVVAAGWLLLLTVVYVFFCLAMPPTAEQFRVSDPLVQWLDPLGGRFGLALLASVIAAVWLLLIKLPREQWKRELWFAVAGSLLGIGVVCAIRVLYGDTLPSFVPPEESAGPGLALGFGAGLIEEALFRLAILPVAYFTLRRHVSNAYVAALLACVITGLLFALSHELGPGAGAFDAVHFMTRWLLPGTAMSLVAIFLHPAFMVGAHCAAHVGIAFLFLAPTVAAAVVTPAL